MKEKYWIAFSAIEQLDSTFIQRLYNYFGDIEAAFNSNLKELQQIEGLSVKKAENFIDKKKRINPDKVYDEIQKRNIKVLTFDNPNYPYMLSQIANPPMTLFYKGDIFSCNLKRTIAFVGSRRASTNGRDSVRKIIKSLANTDICIVSGLASGIDSVSHKSAIDNNLKTIGVIASGFDYTYPSENKHLYEQIENGFGAVVTEYYPTFEPLKFRFPQRNRIVTGLSYGTVVGEAALKSGALISANLTLEQGRELMCIPGSINNTNTEGIYKLIKDGATIVTCGEDILNALNWELEHSQQISPKASSDNLYNTTDLPPRGLPLYDLPPEDLPLEDLPLTQKLIFDIIEIEPRGFDELQTITKLETGKLLTVLTQMEMNGLVELTEGDRYKKT